MRKRSAFANGYRTAFDIGEWWSEYDGSMWRFSDIDGYGRIQSSAIPHSDGIVTWGIYSPATDDEIDGGFCNSIEEGMALCDKAINGLTGNRAASGRMHRKAMRKKSSELGTKEFHNSFTVDIDMTVDLYQYACANYLDFGCENEEDIDEKIAAGEITEDDIVEAVADDLNNYNSTHTESYIDGTVGVDIRCDYEELWLKPSDIEDDWWYE